MTTAIAIDKMNYTEQCEQLRLRYAQLTPEQRADKGRSALKAKEAAKDGDLIGAVLYGALK